MTEIKSLENYFHKLTEFLKKGYVIIDNHNSLINPNATISKEEKKLLIENNSFRNCYYVQDLEKFKVCKKFVNLF